MNFNWIKLINYSSLNVALLVSDVIAVRIANIAKIGLNKGEN